MRLWAASSFLLPGGGFSIYRITQRYCYVYPLRENQDLDPRLHHCFFLSYFILSLTSQHMGCSFPPGIKPAPLAVEAHWTTREVPRLLSLDCSSSVLHLLPSLISSHLNLPIGTQGRSWLLNGAYCLRSRNGHNKAFVPRSPIASCLVSVPLYQGRCSSSLKA